MWSQGSKIDKVKEFLRTPVGLGLALLVMLLIGALVFFSVKRMTGGGRNDSEEATEAFFDEVSGEYVRIYPPTDGVANDKVIYVGFSELTRNGVSADLYSLFRSVIQEYASENGIDLVRVSYVKGSYRLVASYVFDFEVVLNENGERLAVRLDSSKFKKNAYGASVILRDENGETVYELSVDESNQCKYLQRCDADRWGI